MSARQAIVTGLAPRGVDSPMFTSLKEMDRRVRERRDGGRFLIRDVLPHGLVFLYGASGAGKTGIAINLAMSVAMGWPWGGIEIEPAGVLYLAAEDRAGVEERFAAVADRAAVDPSLANIHAINLDRIPIPSEICREAQKIVDLHGRPIRLIVIDTLSAVFGDRSQDDATHAQMVVNQLNRIAAELGCCVLLIHHPGKSFQGRNEMRGSGVFFASADAVLLADGRARTITVTKMRNGREGASFAYEIGGHPLDTCGGTVDVQVVQDIRPVVENDETTSVAKKERWDRTDADIAFARLFEIAQHGTAPLAEWRSACDETWSGKTSGARRTAFAKAKAKLIEGQKITVDGEIVTVTAVTTVTGNAPPVTGGDESVTVTVTVTPPPSLEQGYRT